MVTGGSGGLGSAVCKRLAAEGHAVTIGCFTRLAEAEALAGEIRGDGGRAQALAFDVTDEAAVAAAVAGVVAEFGGLDALVLAAAYNVDGLLATLPPAELARMQTVNVGGVAACVREALPHLMIGGRGRIVTFSSTIAHMAAPGTGGYASTKGAVEALTRTLAVELGSKRITVNAVAPGLIDAGLGREPVSRCTELIANTLPARRAGLAEDVAGAVSFLVSEAAAYVNGAVLPVDGGLLAGMTPPRNHRKEEAP
jgi:3-oxoacyl-[acyl-carrier protein] reductase